MVMKLIHSLHLLLAFSLLYACTESKPSPEEQIEASAPIQSSESTVLNKLFSPIYLNYDQSKIELHDYFLDMKKISRLRLHSGMDLSADSNGVLVLNQAYGAFDVLEVTYDGKAYDIPVFASKKKAHQLKYQATKNYKSVQLAGNMNGWNPSASELTQDKNGIWSIDFVLNPGLYEYQLVRDGEWGLDEGNPNKKDNGQGAFNSTFLVGDAANEGAPFLTSSSASGNMLELSCDRLAKFFVFWNNQLIESSETAITSISISIPEEAKNVKRSHLRAWAVSEGKISNDALIPLENGFPITQSTQLNRNDHEQMIMYFIMLDRFNNGNSANDEAVQNDSILPVANHYGGDLAGITQKINDGYFEDLGVNTLWISPITQNPKGAWGLWNKGITSKFSGYHGYWPVTSTTIDYRFGNSEEFSELIDKTHAADMNILVDYVANHVHQEHNIYQNNPDWATPLYLPDGRMNTELWDEERLTTWFDTFLPTLDFSREEVREAMTDSALFWFENYPIDGFRHDATKHIPEEFWRLLTKKMKERVVIPQNRSIYQIGETYGNPELIRSYVSSGQLDAQFDFNLYDAMVDAFAKDESNFDNLTRVLAQSIEYYGAHHKMGNITGNQDRARFTSYADGAVKFDEDPKLAGWTRVIEHQGDEGYEKMQLLHAFLMTSPGIPCIYYGDEIAMPGANDPDNRRMMWFDNWNEQEQATQKRLKALIQLRKERMSLLYGDLKIVSKDDGLLVMERSYIGERTLIIINKNQTATALPDYLKDEAKAENILIAVGSESRDGEMVMNGRGYLILNLE